MAQRKEAIKPSNKGNQELYEVSCFHHQSFCCQSLQIKDEIQDPSKAGNLTGDFINKTRTLKISECKINLTRQNKTVTKVVSLEKKKSLPRIQDHQLIFTGGSVVQIHTTTMVQEFSSGKLTMVTNRN